VVKAVAESLGLKNVKAEQLRAELVKGDFDFIVSRAVTNMPDFVSGSRTKPKSKVNTSLETAFYTSKVVTLPKSLRISPSHRIQHLRVFQRRVL
jgi:16S rRNA (guanine527-N7)-methyltransferase